jgi:hypothetical protein
LFDWDRPDTHGPALAGVDAVYLVGPELVEDPTAVVGPFLDRAKRAGVTRLVALSSMGVEFPREDPGAGRLKLERQIMASELEWTILRPSGFAKTSPKASCCPESSRPTRWRRRPATVQPPRPLPLGGNLVQPKSQLPPAPNYKFLL